MPAHMYVCTHAHIFMDTGADTQKRNYTLQILKNGLSLQRAGGVTRFRVTQMWQEKDFHFCLLISQHGLCGPSSHPSLSSPNLNIFHKKRASVKKPPILTPNPSYTGVTLRGKLAHWAPSIFLFLVQAIIYPYQLDKTFS